LEDRTVSRRHLKIVKNGNDFFVTDLNSRNGTLYDGAVLPPGVVVPIREGEPIAVGMCIIGLGQKCSETMVTIFESAGITTEITAESGIFRVHKNKTNQKKLELLYKVSRLLDKGLSVDEVLEKMLYYIERNRYRCFRSA
jgi:pSer/pThr/pTyr-binding forkhead associated (FHA) protein